MPEPNQRPPWRIEEGLGQVPLWILVEQRISVMLECDNCRHKAEWSPDYMGRALSKVRGENLHSIASRLRCVECRSEWVRVWKG